jgi:hypothetical protein
MNMKMLFLALTGSLALILTGCVSTVDGRSRAAVPFVTDKVEGQYERPASEVFAAAKDVLVFNGVLQAENTLNNSLEAKVDTRTVWIRVDQVDPKVSRVLVQTRTRGGASDMPLAHEIEKQIALKLVR